MKRFLVCLVAIFAMFVFASCEGTPQAISLELSGYKTDFVVGDTFDDGDLVVNAVYADETKVDVTAEATVSQSADMSTPGKYAVIVSFGGLSSAYQITVAAKANSSSLVSIDVESDGAKKEYEIGEELSLEGVKVYEKYDNTEKDDEIKVVTDLSGYTVKVLDINNAEVTGAFAAYGTYSVVVSKGELTDSYKVSVGESTFASVSDAVAAVLENASKINAGSASVNFDGDITSYEYAFGQNVFTYSRIGAESTHDFYFEGLENEQLFGVSVFTYFDEYEWTYVEEISKAEDTSLSALNGVNYSEFVSYALEEAYGIEALVDGLYQLAVTSEFALEEGFGDYCNTCGTYHAYSYAFSGLLGYYFFDVEVVFGVDSLTSTLSYATVELNGYYSETPEEGSQPDFTKTLEVEQTTGEKTAVSKFKASEVGLTGFDLLYAEEALTAESNLDVTVGEETVVALGNTAPETAVVELNTLLATVTDSEGNETYDANAYFDGEELYVTCQNEGTYTVTVICGNVTKSFKVTASYAELTEFNAYISEYGWSTGETEATVYVGAMVEFSVYANENANANATYALKDSTQEIYLDYWDGAYTFYAETVGTYEIVLTSVANAEFKATITITVQEAPKLEDILSGTWTASSFAFGEITITLSPESEGALKGTATYSVEGSEMYGTVAESGTWTYEWLEAWGQMNCTSSVEEAVYSLTVDTSTYSIAVLQYGRSPLQVEFERPSTLVYDNFDQYADTAALQASGWVKRYSSANHPEELELVDLGGGNKAVKFTFTNNNQFTFRTYFTQGTYSSEYKYIRFKMETTAAKINFWAYKSSGQNAKTYVLSDILASDGYYYCKISDPGMGELGALNSFGIAFNYQNGSHAIIDDIQLCKTKPEAAAAATSYYGTFNHPMTGMPQDMSVTLNSDGTGSFSFLNGYALGSFSYTETDGVITITDVVCDMDVVFTSATLAAGVLSVAPVIDGGECTSELLQQ